MANTTKKPDTKGNNTYTVKVDNNFTGIGAGGIAFAKGVATGVNERMAQWFREHKGYTVTAE
jgi:hypothetical protein